MAAARDVVKLAIYSRFAVILLQFVGNALIPDHDAGVFNPPVAGADKFTIFDRIIFFVLGGFRRWDAVYFLHVAEHGYTYENCAAFFPLYPMIISAAKVLPLPDSVVSQASVLLMFAVGVNLLIFAATAVMLFHLGDSVLRDKELALCAAELFCINPASIFMTAPYTETLFAFLSFCGMFCVSKNQLYSAACIFSASALTRSNGLVSVGFILHYLLQKYVTAKWGAVKKKTDIRKILRPAIDFTIRAGLLSALVAAPFGLYQYYIYWLFCHPENHEDIVSEIVHYGRLQGYKLVGDAPSSWCYGWLPLSYSYIQNQYWGVGFLTYFHMKQIPNFVLAIPVAIFSFWSCWHYYQKQPRLCHTLGLKNVTGNESQDGGWEKPEVFVYIPHLLFLTVFGCLFMHIQVLTRLLFSASPVIYWFTADWILKQGQDLYVWVQTCRKHEDVLSCWILKIFQTDFSIRIKLTLSYYVGYFVVGTLAFSNFLPWT